MPQDPERSGFNEAMDRHTAHALAFVLNLHEGVMLPEIIDEIRRRHDAGESVPTIQEALRTYDRKKAN